MSVAEKGGWARRLLQVASAVSLIFVSVPASAAEEAPRELAVNGFVSASNLPLWVGLRQGYFREEKIDLALSSPSGSVDQIRSLLSGRTPVLLTAFDNVVAYRHGQGAPEIGTVADFVAVAGVDNGMLTLVAAPDITTIGDLKGRTFAVDAMNTGYSFALRGILAQAGFDLSAVPMIAVGSTAGRWKALQEGRASGALLTIPADVVAAEKGFKTLTTVADALGPYLGNVVATRKGWAEEHRPLLVAFLRAYRKSIVWTVSPDNREAATVILRQEMRDLSPELAGRIYSRLVDEQRGISRDLKIDPVAVRADLDLRTRFAPADEKAGAPKLLDPSAYVDGDFSKAAGQ